MKCSNWNHFRPTLVWSGAIALFGIGIAYTPALGNGSSWQMPYSSGSVSTPLLLMSLENSGTGSGLEILCNGSSTQGIYSEAGSSGITGWSFGTTGEGVYGGSTSTSANSYGVYGYGGQVGVYGYGSSGNFGVQGFAPGQGTGVSGTGAIGVEGTSNSAYGAGVEAISTTSTSPAMYGYGHGGAAGLVAASDTSLGIQASSGTNIAVNGTGAIGICGASNGSGINLAGLFQGNVTVNGNLQVNGTINKSAVGFKIDHPLDPAHKFLMHSCIESNEMMNIYRGNATLDSDGKATVIMPGWFEAENRDFGYQLTSIGNSAPGLYVSHKIENNQFEVAGGAPGMEVSWQVTGARNDKYARAHPIVTEAAKSAADQGKFIRPEEYGQPESKMIGYVNAQPHSMARQQAAASKRALIAVMQPVIPAPPSGRSLKSITPR